MLATTTAQLCARQAPLAVGVLLRGPRAVPAGGLLRQRPAGGSRGHAAAAAAAAAEPQPEYTILEYDYVHTDAELLAKRAPYLQDHLRQCREIADQGKLLLWGAVGSPITGGMLIWRGADEDEVRSFVKKDPFVVNGLVRHWTMKPYHVHVVDSK